MVVQLVGVQKICFTDNNSGRVINGITLYVNYSETNENLTGVRTEKFFVKPEISLPKGTEIGDYLDLGFTHRGKLETIKKI